MKLCATLGSRWCAFDSTYIPDSGEWGYCTASCQQGTAAPDWSFTTDVSVAVEGRVSVAGGDLVARVIDGPWQGTTVIGEVPGETTVIITGGSGAVIGSTSLVVSNELVRVVAIDSRVVKECVIFYSAGLTLSTEVFASGCLIVCLRYAT